MSVLHTPHGLTCPKAKYSLEHCTQNSSRPKGPLMVLVVYTRERKSPKQSGLGCRVFSEYERKGSKHGRLFTSFWR